jgi:hypothetical protein
MTNCIRCGKQNVDPVFPHTCTPPKALLLADVLEATHPALWPYGQEAAAELRRQYEEIEGQAGRIQDLYGQLNATEKEVDDCRLLLRQALEALEACLGWPHVIEAIKERLQ